MQQPPNNIHNLFTAREGEKIWLPMLSGSMAPAILPGESVEVSVNRQGGLRWGEVAVFYREGKFTSHRIYLGFKWKRNHILYERGDANSTGSWINRKRVFGVAERVKSVTGDLRDAGRKPFLIFLPAINMCRRCLKKIFHRRFLNE